MSSLESFGRLLHETVGGEKLSASKVERVRDSAAKHFNHGAKASAIIIKVHRKASRRCRLSSLYLFDATCRYAADIVRKKGSGFDYQEAEPPNDSRAQPGTKQALIDSASNFLFSASGIVEEIVLTTMQEVREDQKSKVTKVVDIWIKAGTFDNGLLTDIKLKLDKPAKQDSTSTNIPTSSNKGVRLSDQEIGQEGGSIGSPYGILMQESEQKTQTNTPPQIPTNLLALLGGGSKSSQVDAVAELQSNGNGSNQTATGLDASQIAMLQQFAQNKNRQKATGVNEVPNPQLPQNLDQAPGPPPPQPSIPKITPSISKIPEARPHSIAAPPVQAAPNIVPPASMDADTGFSFVPDQSIGDLSQFNFTLFDPTSAIHWVHFAQHWHNTYQYVPSNQECLWAMMSAIQSQSYMAAGYDNNSSW